MKRCIAVLSCILMLAGVARAELPSATDAIVKQALSSGKPTVIDLGARSCIPCKKMAPIIEALKKDYAGIVDVIFIDVWKDPKAGTPYRIRLIPTQVFFDRTGKEVFRHEGFFSREDIEKVFKEKLGVTPVVPDDEKKDESERSTGARL